MIMTEWPLGRDLGLVYCCLIMYRRMQGTMLRMNEVGRLGTSQEIRRLTLSTAFLSWLKLSVYMAIVSVAIILSFHLKSEPTPLGKSRANLYVT